MSESEATFHVPMICEVLDRLAHEIRESRKVHQEQFKWLKDHGVEQITSEQLNKRLAELLFSIQGALTQTENKLMSVISDFSDKVEAQFGVISSGVDGIVASITAIDGDVKQLKQQILDLQNSPGAITPEDQARLDKIEAGVSALSTKTSAAATAAATLDQQTENVPVPPV